MTVKSNKPIDFLDLFSEKREELEQNLEKFSDPSGMTEYFQKLESRSLSKVEQTIDDSVFKELLVADSKEIVTYSSKINIEEKLSGLKVVFDELSLKSLDWEELMEKTKELPIAIKKEKISLGSCI